MVVRGVLGVWIFELLERRYSQPHSQSRNRYRQMVAKSAVGMTMIRRLHERPFCCCTSAYVTIVIIFVGIVVSIVLSTDVFGTTVGSDSALTSVSALIVIPIVGL